MSYIKYIIVFCCTLLFTIGADAQRYMQDAIRRPDDYKQRIRLGLRAGINFSDLNNAKGLDIWNGLAYFNLNEEYIGFTDTKPFQYGFNLGVAAQARIYNNFWWQVNLLFTTKGYKLNTQQVEIDAKGGYIQLPVDLIYKYPVKDISLIASVGAFLGVGVWGDTKFIDHYGEDDMPRLFHQDLQKPYINEELNTTNLIGCDYTVHNANTYWADEDASFMTDGHYIIDAGLQVGLGVEWSHFQLMLSYQYSLTYLYNYNYDFSARYEEKGGKYAGYRNSFEYFGLDVMTSPRLNVFSISLTYFFDNWKHNLKL